jgi:hypothetical protein
MIDNRLKNVWGKQILIENYLHQLKITKVKKTASFPPFLPPSLPPSFCSMGDRFGTEGFVLARQVCYHISHAFSPSCSGYFGDRVSLLAQACLNHVLLFYASHCPRMTGHTHPSHT